MISIFKSFKSLLILGLLLAGAVANAAISAKLQASRVEGPAPLAVNFDALGTTHTDSNMDAFRQLAYGFNFGDPTSGAWAISGKSKNVEIGGPLAAHVFEKPGTYVVSLTVKDESGETDVDTVQITVLDPDVYYSGTNTVCVSGNSNYSGAPAGCDRRTSMPSVDSGKRYLLRAGESFGGMSVNFEHNWQIGKFGSGANPVINGDVGVQSSNPGSQTDWVTNGVVMDLDVRGAMSLGISGQNILFLRNSTTSKFSVGTTTRYYFDNNGNSSSTGYSWPSNVFIVENEMDGKKNSSTGRYNVYGFAQGYSIMGNDFTNPYEHNLRSPLSYKSFIAHNHLSNPGDLKHHIKIHGQGLQPFQSRLADEMSPSTRYLVISNNQIGDGDDSNHWAIATCPMNDKVLEGISDVIVENNDFHGDNLHEIAFGGVRHISRNNNTGLTEVTTTTGCQAGSLPGSWRGPYYIDHELIQLPSLADLIDVGLPSPPTPPLNLTAEVVE